MAISFAKLAAEIWRDFTIAINPASGFWNPLKTDIRTWGASIENWIIAADASIASFATSLASVVQTTGAQTIAGIKTFTSPINVPDPTSDQNPVTRAYFNANAPPQYTSLAPVDAATTAALPSNVYANGTAGVGATLTGSANGALPAQDGVTLTAGKALLVKNEAAPANNGVYTVTTLGDGSTKYVLTRRTDADTAAELARFASIVLGGSLNVGKTFGIPLIASNITVGTTALNPVIVATSLVAAFSTNADAIAGARTDVAMNPAADRAALLAGLATVVTTIDDNQQIVGTPKGSPLPTSLAWALRSPGGFTPLGVTPDGTLSIAKYDANLAAAVAATPITLVANNGLLGASQGSPLPSGLTLNYVMRSVSGYAGFGVAPDGSFWIAKYDANLAAAVSAATFTDGLITDVAGQIVRFDGSTQTVLSTEGTSSNVRDQGNRVVFLNDRMRGVKAPYYANRSFLLQHSFLRTPVYEFIAGWGQSLAVNVGGTFALTTTNPYSNNLLMLLSNDVYRQPMRLPGSSMAPNAILGPSVEGAGKETPSTSMGICILDKELPNRPNMKIVMGGNGVSGALYSAIKKGTTCFTDIMNQAARVGALAGFLGGLAIFRAFWVQHGESDWNSSTYLANLLELDTDVNTDGRTATGQKEPIYLIMSQTASIRSSGQAPTTLNLHKSALAQLAASQTSPRIFLSVPDYILAYQSDYLHITEAAERLLSEYFAKTYDCVVHQGREWKGVRPKTVTWANGAPVAFNPVTISGNVIDIVFDVQVGPLVLDYALVSAGSDCPNFGFTYADDAGRTISSVALKAGTTDTVRITLSAAPGTNAKIDYAYNNGTANMSGPTAGVRGCLRDSDPALSRWDGTTHLYNPCAIFQLALN